MYASTNSGAPGAKNWEDAQSGKGAGTAGANTGAGKGAGTAGANTGAGKGAGTAGANTGEGEGAGGFISGLVQAHV